VDQREWDYGTRMSRNRRAAGPWPTREQETEEPEPRWSSLTDTGSMAPSDEALAWQRRADDWAQQAEVEPYTGGSQALEPVNRWSSEVTPAGRPTFPADGAGWRTETAEWRATGARWRQTTEWRSATGSHVWRSTTEAWGSENDTAPERDKPSIPGTSWPTPESESTRDATPAWRQPAAETPSWRRAEPDTSSSWQQRPDGPAATTPVEQTPSWRQPSTQIPTWQQPAAQTPSWQQPQQTPSWQEPSTQTPSWQQSPAPAPSWQQPQQTPSWQQPSPPQQPSTPPRRRAADPGPAAPASGGTWSTAAASGPSWSSSGAAWQDRTAPADAPAWQDRPGPGENTTGLTRWERTEAPGWQRSPAEDARHLVREDDRAAWSRDAGYGDRPTRAGRRRAAESDTPPSGGSGWSSQPDTDNWAGHTDTGSITPFSDQARAPEAPTWGARSEAPSRRDRRRQAEESRPEEARPEPARPETPARRSPRRYNTNTTNWREDTASWAAEEDTSNWTRDPDTGQWSRAEDDPRVLAWRAEAARRESTRDPGPESPGRRTRRDEPVGGVPGGPLPSSSVPAADPGGAAWSTSGVPVDDSQTGRRRRADEAYRTDEPYRTDTFGGGRRRATDPVPPAEEPPLGPEAWRVAPESRQSRQYRRLNVEPDEYPVDGARSAGYPADGARPGPMPPQWGDPAVQEPRRRPNRDETRTGTPTWQDPGYGGTQRELPSGPGYGQTRPEPPRSGFGSAARELPAGPATPQRPVFGARELPAGPTPPQQPTYGGPARELPAAPASGQSWLEQERERRQAQQRPAYGDPAAEQPWLDEERQRQAPQRPAYGGPGGDQSWTRQRPQSPSYGVSGIPAQPASYDVPGSRRPARELPAGGPAWAEQQKPAYGGAEDLSARWPDPLTDTSARRGSGERNDPPPPAGGGFGDRPPLADWLAAERAGRRGADYRGAGQDGETDWRRELSRQSDLADGESRRYDTSDFPPFRPSGTATVGGSANLALSATSVIAVPSAAPAGAAVEDTSWPPRRGTGAFQGTGSYERRPAAGVDEFYINKPNDLLDPDDDEEPEQASSPLAAVGFTVVWYGVPVVLFVFGMFLLNSGQRSNALDTLADAAPQFGISLALSMLVAYGLRSATTAWKSASVGLAAAVVGGGLATVLSSAITGNSLS
jgi:hypothetical protein